MLERGKIGWIVFVDVCVGVWNFGFVKKFVIVCEVFG